MYAYEEKKKKINSVIRTERLPVQLFKEPAITKKVIRLHKKRADGTEDRANGQPIPKDARIDVDVEKTWIRRDGCAMVEASYNDCPGYVKRADGYFRTMNPSELISMVKELFVIFDFRNCCF